MSEKISLRAYGKINLGLDVVRKREDGYHEVRMIMQTVSVYDMLELERTDTPGIELKTNLAWLPVNEGNLAYRAADSLRKEFHIKQGVRINLRKHIPVAAGMAGGSTDAAAVLRGVNRLFSLGLSDEELMKRGVKLGADVPYCIIGGTALSEGIGEILTPLPPVPDCYILIAKSSVSVSTRFVYENLKADELRVHPDIDGMAEAIKAGELRGVIDRLGNVLETVTIPAYPVIKDIKDSMREHGAENVLMSGSGPTVFGIFNKEETIHSAAEALKKTGLAKQIYEAEPVNAQQVSVLQAGRE
ncbi:MAG: 4-(cytidine 5'-diphospho)-2-C-methyl-D-erythritol kinase [Lachnospiraceae bacterium]|nr:4-(cytidine 5'-diphospho)-2-C-methyl-D-erythritol kinase [Lachnospiraceae bacterium]